VNTDRLKGHDALKAFVDFYMTDTGIAKGVQQAGYVDLPTDRISATRSTWTKTEGA
jgi:ABC-type phosphate transport system substrate-binding protein